MLCMIFLLLYITLNYLILRLQISCILYNNHLMHFLNLHCMLSIFPLLFCGCFLSFLFCFSLFKFIFFTYLFIYSLYWVFIAACRLSPVAASRGYPLVAVCVLLLMMLPCSGDTGRWTPQVVGAQYSTGEEWRNNTRKNDEKESQWKQCPVVDVTADGSKIWCCK